MIKNNVCVLNDYIEVLFSSFKKIHSLSWNHCMSWPKFSSLPYLNGFHANGIVPFLDSATLPRRQGIFH